MSGNKRVTLASPRPRKEMGECDFVVASLGLTASDAKLYTYNYNLDTIRMTSIIDDLVPKSQIKSFAWSPHPAYSTLLAFGSLGGNIRLLTFDPLLSPPSTSPSRSRSTPDVPPSYLAALPIRHNRGCTSLAWSKVDPHYLVAGYDKARNEPSVLIWDVEMALAASPHPPLIEGFVRDPKSPRLDILTPQTTQPTSHPIQQYCPMESINSLETMYHSLSTILVSSNSKSIRLLDLRIAGSTNPDTPPTSWQTKATHGLTASPTSPHLFAAHEDGLSGIVKVFDLRSPPPSGAVTPVAAAPAAGEMVSYEAGAGGVVGLAWGSEGGTLGIATRQGGAVVLDVMSAGGGEGNRGDIWSGFVSVRKTNWLNQPLQGIAFLPSAKPNETTLLSVWRDGTYGIDKFSPSPIIATGATNETTILSPSHIATLITPTPSRVSPPKKASAQGGIGRSINQIRLSLGSDVSPTRVPAKVAGRRERTWEEVVQEDVGVVMRAKAEARFGLKLSLNDEIEARYPTSDGFLYLWLERFVGMMGRRTVSMTDAYDFTLQGLCGIWNGNSISEAEDTSSRSGRATSRPPDIQRGFPADHHLSVLPPRSDKTPTPRSPNLSSTSRLRGNDLSQSPEYVQAILAIMDGRDADFVSTGIQAVTGKMHHRRLMLGICGELTGDRLEVEIERIAVKQATKAACLALFNGNRDKSIDILRRSSNETHRLMSTLLLQPKVDRASVVDMRLSDPYLRAIVQSLSGAGTWNEIIDDQSVPLLERLVIALRFVGDADLSIFLHEQSRISIKQGSLHGLVLTGLTGDSCLELLERYIDRTSDLQTTAILAAYVYNKPRKVDRWIETYRDMLDSWKLFLDRVDYDRARGEIARSQGTDIHKPAETVIRCNYCQRSMGAEKKRTGVKVDGHGVRTNCCPNCQNPWPRCSICTSVLDGPQSSESTGYTIDSALVFCQTCHHGGHQAHILDWFYGPLLDPELYRSFDLRPEIRGTRHELCAVAGCGCACARL